MHVLQQSILDYCKNGTVCWRDFCSVTITHVTVLRPGVVVTFVKFCVHV